MNSEEEFFKKYAEKGFQSGGEVYFDITTAIEILNEECNSDIAFIGIELFKKEGNSITPLIGKILDLSNLSLDNWGDFKERCSNEALIFLNSIIDKNMVASLTILIEEEWSQKRV